MSINSALLAGVSGLTANSAALAAISQNIANVNTVGYKRTAGEFQTVVNAQSQGAGYSAGGVMASASNYIGKDATAAWSATKFKDGKADWSYEVASNADSVKLEVLDGSGNVVWSGDAPAKTTGVHEFSWDGEATTGNDGQEDQVYTLKVIAKNAAGGAIDAQVLTRGRITGVEMYDGEAYLTVGNAILPLSSVIALEEARTAETTPPAEEDESLLASMASSLNPMNLFS